MKIQGLPTTGCNVFYGTYMDNYQGNTRRRYYLNDGNLVLSQTTTNTSQPTGVNCITELNYKPEVNLYTSLLGCASATIIAYLAIKIIIGRALK